MTPQSYCWAYTPGKPELKETYVPQCSLYHCLQELRHGSNLDVHHQMNGQGSCGTYIQWNIAQPQKRDKIWSFVVMWTGEGNGTPLQYSCLENPRDRGAW